MVTSLLIKLEKQELAGEKKQKTETIHFKVKCLENYDQYKMVKSKMSFMWQVKPFFSVY